MTKPENHAMPCRTITTMLLVVALLACGADDKKDAGKKDEPKKDKPPACMHCGAACGLTPICVCESGTKKQPKIEFDVTCAPICVAGCGSTPWPFGRCRDRVGCTTCREEPCRCPGWVRSCKTLKKETTDEEVPTIKRSVAHICNCCAGRCTAGCCGTGPARRAPSWWTSLTSWMAGLSSRGKETGCADLGATRPAVTELSQEAGRTVSPSGGDPNASSPGRP